MTLDELSRKSILILGFGTEGQATYDFLRKKWPEKPLSIAENGPLDEFSDDVIARIQDDTALNLNFGPRYLDSADGYNCDVIIKTPGIPASLQAIARARKAGRVLTSHSQIFLDNYPRRNVIGVTGTKGKSTTASLIHHILKSSGVASVLVGNIGQPPLVNYRYGPRRHVLCSRVLQSSIGRGRDQPSYRRAVEHRSRTSGLLRQLRRIRIRKRKHHKIPDAG